MSVMARHNNSPLRSLQAQELISVELWSPARRGLTSHCAPWDSITVTLFSRGNQKESLRQVEDGCQ